MAIKGIYANKTLSIHVTAPELDALVKGHTCWFNLQVDGELVPFSVGEVKLTTDGRFLTGDLLNVEREAWAQARADQEGRDAEEPE